MNIMKKENLMVSRGGVLMIWDMRMYLWYKCEPQIWNTIKGMMNVSK